jgi:3-deoxy-7-phosphoheptulonate synthase
LEPQPERESEPQQPPPGRIDDARVQRVSELPTPERLVAEVPLGAAQAATVAAARAQIHRLLHGQDDRLLLVVGPCSIHDPEAALDYAARLQREAERHRDALLLVMRVYFEKPRTTVGWKGLINDPGLDGSFAIHRGLSLARRLLAQITGLGLPCATEFLDTITPQYTADLIAWGAIGARTTESQVHRELASGLSCPVGFKNGTDGNVGVAVDAVRAAASAHHFLSIDKSGRPAIVTTSGNDDCHLVLRGGHRPNYDEQSLAAACAALREAGLPERPLVDCSHGNSGKQPERQARVARELCARVAAGEQRLLGLMLESNLLCGRQELSPGRPLVYGQSVTDACLGWEESAALLDEAAAAVRARRAR